MVEVDFALLRVVPVMADTAFLEIKSLADLQRALREGAAESLYLDFKASEAPAPEKINEICKDVTAFANAAGGQMVYGVTEDKIANTFSVDGGVKNPKISREWLDNILKRVQPPLQGVRIDRFEVSQGAYAFVITIPQTQTGPHQANDHRYYTRTELQSAPMNDFAVRDVRGRAMSPVLSANLAFDTGRKKHLRYDDERAESISLFISIDNLSPTPALYTSLLVGVDASSKVIHVDQLQSMGQRRDADGKTFRWYQRQFAVPNDMPIFKEAIYGVPNGTIHFILPEKNAIVQYDIRVTVETPGFSKRWDWIMHKFGPLIEMEPDPAA